MSPTRQEVLWSLLRIDRCLGEIRRDLSHVGWDCDEDVVSLTRGMAIDILQRFLEGDLNTDEIEEWANLIEGREDIGCERGYASALRDLIHELANPVLTRELTPAVAHEWVGRLRGAPKV